MQKLIDGKKAYIIAALMALVGVTNVAAGDLTLTQLLQGDDVKLILGGGALGAVRSALEKIKAALSGRL